MRTVRILRSGSEYAMLLPPPRSRPIPICLAAGGGPVHRFDPRQRAKSPKWPAIHPAR